MDSNLIKKFSDRIYQIYQIIFLHFQFPEETGNIQCAFSGNTHSIKYCPFKLIRLDAAIYDMD
jgi:hypothetical protein